MITTVFADGHLFISCMISTLGEKSRAVEPLFGMRIVILPYLLIILI